jgi:hypothetical protein
MGWIIAGKKSDAASEIFLREIFATKYFSY